MAHQQERQITVLTLRYNSKHLPVNTGRETTDIVAFQQNDLAKPELYTALDNAGAMGNRTFSGAQASWKTTMEHLKDKLGCNTAHLKIGLSLLKQGEMDMVSFA